jgi:hypothetical protein
MERASKVAARNEAGRAQQTRSISSAEAQTEAMMDAVTLMLV